jgi:thioesterase domain-containing protein
MASDVQALLQPVSDLDRLASKLLSMPPLRAMGVTVAGYDGESLQLCAPLAANVNDKGNAFGGSQAGLLTVAAWGLMTLRLMQAGRVADVYVQDTSLRYLTPVYEDLKVTARLAEGQRWSDVLAAFDSKRKARARLQASLWLSDGREASSMEGRFVALTCAD